MGLQQGTLLREPLRELVREYLYERIALERGTVHAWLLTYARLVEREVPSDLSREMQGIADGAGLSYQDVLLLNTVPDLLALTYGLPSWELSPSLFSSAKQSAVITQSPVRSPKDDGTLSCATFAAWGRATVSGGLFVGHNLDSAEAGLLGRYLSVVVRRPSQANTFVAIGLMGTVGVWTGMNEEEVTVTLSSSPSVDLASNGRLLPFLCRRVLESAGDLTEALDVLLPANRLCGGNVVLGDGKVPEAIAVELSAHRHAVFEADAERDLLARTNHFLDPGLALAQRDVLSEQERAASEVRLDGLQTLLKLKRGWIDADKGLALLRDDHEAGLSAGIASGGTVYGTHTLQSVLLHPEGLTIWVAQVGGTTPLGSYVNLALTSLPPECLGNR
jgi:hypothetical protein